MAGKSPDKDEIDEEKAGEHPDNLDSSTLYVYLNGRFWPVRRKRRGRLPRYPIEKLRPKESMFFEGHEAPITGIYVRARALGIKIAQRVVEENGKVGVRVWHLGPRTTPGK